MDSRELVLSVECERLRDENQRLRAENNQLRPTVSKLQHKLCLLERPPHDLPTDPLIRKNSEPA